MTFWNGSTPEDKISFAQNYDFGSGQTPMHGGQTPMQGGMTPMHGLGYSIA
jgi:hypothetical protein